MRLRAGRSLLPRRLLSQAGWAFLLGLLVLLPSGARIAGQARAAAPAAADPLLPILTDELQRNMEGLKGEATPPYFASYTVYDVQSAFVRASFGALVGEHQQRSRSAVVDVRVGDYALDNTREIRGDMMSGFRGFSRTALPLPGPQGEPDDAVRAVLWRATDRKFKQAIERFTKVKTNVAAKVQDGVDVADLSREPPQTFSEPARPAPADVTPWEGRLRRVSAPFGEQPLVLTSDATLTVETTRRYFVSTEGSQIVTSDTTARLMISATTKADDGMELPLYRSYFAQDAGRPAGRGAARRGRARDGRPARGAAIGAGGRSLFRPGDPVGPRRRRVLPRDLRPPHRGAPHQAGRRRADLRQEAEPAGAAGVPERRLRSDARARRHHRARRPLRLRRRRREGAARRGGGQAAC